MEQITLLEANKPEKLQEAINILLAYFNRAQEIPTITKQTLGLENVDNTSDANKPVSIAQKAYIDSLDAKNVKLTSETKQSLNSDIELADGKKFSATRGNGSSADVIHLQNSDGFESIDFGDEDLALRLFHCLIDINGINVGKNPKVVVKDGNGTKTTEILAYKSDIQAAIAELISSAPETLDTLNEIATAITGNKNLIEALNEAIANKVPKEDGKTLSSNDYTDADKEKVQGILTSAQISQMIDDAIGVAVGGEY